MEFTVAVVGVDAPPRILENAIALNVRIWNLALLSPAEQGQELWRLREDLNLNQDPVNSAHVDDLLELRKMTYPNDLRHIRDYQISYDDEGALELTAEWVDMGLLAKSLEELYALYALHEKPAAVAPTQAPAV